MQRAANEGDARFDVLAHVHPGLTAPWMKIVVAGWANDGVGGYAFRALTGADAPGSHLANGPGKVTKDVSGRCEGRIKSALHAAHYGVVHALEFAASLSVRNGGQVASVEVVSDQLNLKLHYATPVTAESRQTKPHKHYAAHLMELAEAGCAHIQGANLQLVGTTALKEDPIRGEGGLLTGLQGEAKAAAAGSPQDC